MRPHDAIERALIANDGALLATLGVSERTTVVGKARTAEERRAAGSLTTRRLSDIEAKPVSWLWPGRMARGKTTIIAGNPGLGKSQITASIAAIVTSGGCWPVDRNQCEVGNVLILTAEDDAADTLRPRLEAAGADLTCVHIIDGVVRGYTGEGDRKNRTFSLEDDLDALEAKLKELGNVSLLVIDPISAYLGGADSHKNAEVRALLMSLSELAVRNNVAILGVSHLSKGAGASALMRVSGSLAFVAAARAAYLVTEDPQDKTRRLFLPMKNNIGRDSAGLGFRIRGTTIASTAGPLETSSVLWDAEPVLMSADEAMQGQGKSGSVSALDIAQEWLRETLSDGPLAVAEVNRLAKVAGVAGKTLQRASDGLNVQKEKLKTMNGGWRWSLPSKVANNPEDGHENNLATFGNLDHLREPGGQMAEVEL